MSTSTEVKLYFIYFCITFNIYVNKQINLIEPAHHHRLKINEKCAKILWRLFLLLLPPYSTQQFPETPENNYWNYIINRNFRKPNKGIWATYKN